MRRLVKNVANRALSGVGLHIAAKQLERLPEEQLLLALTHFEIDTVIDIGANTGQFGSALFGQGYEGQVYSVEPLPEAYASLRARAHGEPRWMVMERSAVGSAEGVIQINVAGNSYSSSVLDMLDRHVEAAPESATVGKIEAPLTTIDKMFGSIVDANNRSILLKIDTQGYEAPALKGALRTLASARLVLLELSIEPLYKDQVLWLELIHTMSLHGFAVWSIQPEFCDPHTGQLLQVNGLFFRNSKA